MSHPHVETARRWFEQIWNQRRTDLIESFVSEESVSHMEGGDVASADEFRAMHQQFTAAFPDLQVTVEETVADDDNVVVRWRATGTHHGDGLGLKATGRPISIRGMTWLKFRDGKFVEGWDSWNQGALFESLK